VRKITVAESASLKRETGKQFETKNGDKEGLRKEWGSSERTLERRKKADVENFQTRGQAHHSQGANKIEERGEGGNTRERENPVFKKRKGGERPRKEKHY